MNPEQALHIVTQAANGYLCNKQERMILDQALSVLHQVLQPAPKAPESVVKEVPAAS